MVRARSYGSYARDRNRGFNPPILPDVSEKILREGERTIKSQADAYQAELNNRQQILNKQKENWQLQRRANTEDFNWQMELAGARRDAELQHYKTAIDNVEVKKAEWERNKKTRDAVISLIPKAIEAYGTFDTERTKVMQKEYDRIMSSMELTLEEKQHVAFVERQANQKDKTLRRILERERSNGRINDREKDLLLNLSGRRELIAQKWAIKRASPQIINETLANNLNTPFQFGNEYLTLQSAVVNGNPGDVERVLTRIQTELIAENWGLNSQNPKHYSLLNETFTPTWNETVKNYRTIAATNYNEKVNNAAIKIDLEAYMDAVTSPNPGTKILEAIDVNSGGNRDNYGGQKELFAGGLARAFAEGDIEIFNSTLYNKLLDTDVRLNEDTNPMSLPDFLGKDMWGLIEKKYFDRQNKNYEAIEENQAFLQQQADASLYELIRKGGLPDKKALIAFERQHYIEQGIKSSEYIKSLLAVEPSALKNQRQELEDQKNSPEGLNWITLTSGKYIPALVEDYKRYTVNGPNTLSSDYVQGGYDEIEALIKMKLGYVRNNVLELGDEAQKVSRIAIKMAMERWHKNIGKFDTIEEAFDEAILNTKEKLEAGFKGTPLKGGEIFKYDTKQKKFVDIDEPIDIRLKEYRYRDEALKDGIKFLTHGNFDDKALKTLEDVRKGSELPSWIYQLDHEYKNLSPYEIANIILHFNDKKPIKEPGIDFLPSLIPINNPVKKELTSNPSLAKTQRCLKKFSTKKQLILEACKSSKAVNETGSVEGSYNYYEVKGIPTKLPNPFIAIDYVNQGINYPDEQAELGPYLFKADDINHAIKKGWILPNEELDAKRLDWIQGKLINEKTSKFQYNDEDVIGIGKTESGLIPLAVELISIESANVLNQTLEGFKQGAQAYSDLVPEGTAEAYSKPPESEGVSLGVDIAETLKNAFKNLWESKHSVEYGTKSVESPGSAQLGRSAGRNIKEVITEKIKKWETDFEKYLIMRKKLLSQGFDVDFFIPEVQTSLMKHVINYEVS